MCLSCAWAPSRGQSSRACWPESLVSPLCPPRACQLSCQESHSAGKWASNRSGAAPQTGERTAGTAFLSAGTWLCCQLWFLNESNFQEFGSVCFSAQRMQVFSALPRGNTNNSCIPLWDNLFWTNLLYHFGVLEAVVLFLTVLISEAPQRPYQKQGIIFLAIQNIKQCPPQRWWSQYVLEAKGRMQWSKGVMQQGSSSQPSIRLMAKWRLEVGFPGTVACTHFSSHPNHHTCTLGLKWNLSSCPQQTVCLGRLPEYFFSKRITSALLTVRISPHKHSYKS